MLVGGERVGSSSARTYAVCNPASGETAESVPLGSRQDVDQAVQAAHEAFGVWAETPAQDRGVALASACALITEHAAEIAQLLTAEQGNTLFEANLEIHHLVHGLEFYAGLASKVWDASTGPRRWITTSSPRAWSSTGWRKLSRAEQWATRQRRPRGLSLL